MTVYLFAIGLIAFSVGISLYRYRLREVAKYEQYAVAFMRIGIAANNNEDGFQTEVMKSLTENAFHFEAKSGILGGGDKAKKVESPLPGHSASDITSELLSKILNSFEVRAEPKK